MSVTDVVASIGSWSLTLKDNTPQQVLDKIGYFGHVAISAGHVDPILAGDGLLTSARYVGVVRERNFGEDNKGLKGAGMAVWLGDEDKKGEVIEAPGIQFTDSTFANAATQLIPSSLLPGNISPLAGLHTQLYLWQSRRQALDYLTSLYNAEWRVNGNGTVDVGAITDLFSTTPKTAIVRNREGRELAFQALPGRATLDSDTQDFTTRVVLLKNGETEAEGSTVTGTADIQAGLNPYRDLRGNPIKFTRIIEETQTDPTNGQARAQLQLNRFTSPRDALKLNTDYYDIEGEVRPGDYVWVYDPAAKLMDPNTEQYFKGEIIRPLKLRVFQLTWPVSEGMGVAFRSGTGEWVDLTPYVEFESGSTDVVVGGYNRSLTGGGSTTDPIGSVPTTNTTVPRAPEITGFDTTTYQSDNDGLTRAQVELRWSQPLNTDDSIITDGAQYEIRFRTGATALYPASHFDMTFYRHNQMTGPHASPIPFTEGAWVHRLVNWDTRDSLFLDLTPGIPYDFQVRALDNFTPPNTSVWSDLETIQTRPDTTAPSAPAPAQIVSSPAAIQVIHTLGRASGGEFNLEADLNHLRVHKVVVSEEECTPANLLGKIPANRGMMLGKIPAIGTLQLDTVDPFLIKVVAVDNFGNESLASLAVPAQGELWDDVFISSLSVSKVLAGTIMANWILGAQIATATTGARVVFGYWGLDLYNTNNVKTLTLNAATGEARMIGGISSGVEGRRVEIRPGDVEVRFYPEFGETRWASVHTWIPGAPYTDDVAIEMYASDSDTTAVSSRLWVLPDQMGMQTYPQDDSSRGYSGVRSAISSAWMYVNDLAKVGGVWTEQIRSKVGIDDGSSVLCEVWDANGKKKSDSWLMTSGARMYCYDTNGLRSRVELYENGQAILGGINNNYVLVGPSGSQLVSNGTVKAFVIDHPDDDRRYLVHGCTESPLAGVEYWGEVEIRNGFADVALPDYFESLTKMDDRQVQVTVIGDVLARVAASRISAGRFRIRSDAPDGTCVAWLCKAARWEAGFDPEPLRDNVIVRGDGPYTYIEEQ